MAYPQATRVLIDCTNGITFTFFGRDNSTLGSVDHMFKHELDNFVVRGLGKLVTNLAMTGLDAYLPTGQESSLRSLCVVGPLAASIEAGTWSTTFLRFENVEELVVDCGPREVPLELFRALSDMQDDGRAPISLLDNLRVLALYTDELMEELKFVVEARRDFADVANITLNLTLYGADADVSDAKRVEDALMIFQDLGYTGGATHISVWPDGEARLRDRRVEMRQLSCQEAALPCPCMDWDHL